MVVLLTKILRSLSCCVIFDAVSGFLALRNIFVIVLLAGVERNFPDMSQSYATWLHVSMEVAYETLFMYNILAN